MHVVVTGSTGFIGSHLVRALAAGGHRVTTLARRPGVPSLAEHHPVDVETLEARNWAARGQAIVHLAGLSDASSSLADPFTYNRVNALGTLNMLEAARQGGAHLILASTQRVYRASADPLPEEGPKDPVDPYAYSKLVAETWVEMYNRVYGLGATVLRFFSVYGPGQMVRQGNSGVASILVQRALRGEDLWVDGGRLRDLTHVADVVRGIELALASPVAGGRTYNVATGASTELTTLARMVTEVAGVPVAVHVREAGGPPTGYVANIERARRELGYQPQVDLRVGLESYVRWLREESAASA